MILPKKEKSIQVPEGGWEERTYYAVVCAVSPQNPMWTGVLFTGFLNGVDGGPGGYSGVWTGGDTGESLVRFQDLHFLKILRKLDVPEISGHLREEDLAKL